MPAVNNQLFANSPTLHVGDVLLQATDELRIRREKLARIILDEMCQFVVLLDADGNVLDVNRVALEGAGIRLDDIQGKPFWHARWWGVSRETQQLQQRLVARAGAGEFVRCDIEVYGEAAGEETIIIDYSLEPVRDRERKVVFLLAEGRNITEGKRAEAAIARRNEELQQLLDIFQELDQLKSDFFANVSHEFRTPLALILGPAEAILSSANNLTDLQRRDLAVIQRNATTLLKHLNDLLDVSKLDAGRHTVDYARVDLTRQVRAGAAHFDALAPQRSLSYAVTAPEALQAEKRAEDEQKKLASLVENGTDFIGIASPEGRLTFVNQAGRRIVGLDLDEDLTQLTIDDFMAESDREKLRTEILPQLLRNGHWEGEALFRNFRTGAATPMWHHVFFILDAGSRRIAMGSVSRDLSDRKQAEAAIQAAQSQLAHMARVTMMGELAAAIAHDVNQPLAAVVANANACTRWLSGARPDLDEARAAAGRIAVEGKRASEVLGRIRAFMKNQPARLEPVDLNDVVHQILDLLRSEIRRHGISLRLDLASELPQIRGDAIQFQQVLLNLIVNAIDATAARHNGQREIVLRTAKLPPAEALVAVRDSGVGIDTAEVDRLFDPFYTTKPTGMGMGLSISRSIVEAHGGRLWATQNQGPGATFQFSIPARQAS